jgi:multiple sugar transport system substrate-binding protein
MHPFARALRPQPISRRAFLQLVGLGGGAAALAACAPSAGSAPTAAPGDVTSAASEPVAISFWTPGGSDAFCGGFNTIAQNFSAVEPGIQVQEVRCGVTESDSFNQVLLSDIAAGSPPDSTILWTSPVAFAARNALEPLDALMAGSQFSKLENWPPGVLASCQWKGQTFGLPATAGTYAMYYNAEAFEARGIPADRASFPKTWDELRRLSAEFVEWDGDTLRNAGFMPRTEPVELTVWSALNGGTFYDSENQKFLINSDQNIEFFQFFVDWLDEQYQGDWVKVQASDNWGAYADGNGRPPAFQEGRLAIHMDGFWLTVDIYGAEFKGWGNWNVAPFPVGPSGSNVVSGYWPNWLVIPRGSAHVAEAFKYLDYMAVEGIKVWFNNIPDLPANRLVSTDLVPRVMVENRGQEIADDITAFFRGQLDVATPMWDSPVQDFANDRIREAADKIINKVASPRDALTEAQDASQTELDNTLAG